MKTMTCQERFKQENDYWPSEFEFCALVPRDLYGIVSAVAFGIYLHSFAAGVGVLFGIAAIESAVIGCARTISALREQK